MALGAAGVAVVVLAVVLGYFGASEPAPSPAPAASVPDLSIPLILVDPIVPPAPPAAAPPDVSPAPVVAPARPKPEDPDKPALTFLSVPSGARVFVDGMEVGRTPLRRFAVPRGRHRLRMVRGKAELKKRIGVSKRSARRYTWRVESGDLDQE